MGFTPDECRQKAAEQLAEAERNDCRQKTILEESAKAWLLLANGLEPGPKK
jgi:hypothetical protein